MYQNENSLPEVIENAAFFKLSYGLFVLSANENGRDNACIINTVMQITSNPCRISIAVNKANYTHDMILNTGIFNVSVLSTDAGFPIFERFGFASGRDTDKFAGLDDISRSGNGLLCLTKNVNAAISAKVIKSEDFETHTQFTAEVTSAKILSSTPSMTYQYYFDNVKPKPQTESKSKKGFICKICGFVYAGETLPADYICPICKHGAEDFEPIV